MQTVLLDSLSQDDPIHLSYMGSSFGPQKAHASFTEVWAVPNQPVCIFCLESVLANWLRTFQIRISYRVLSVSYAEDHFSSGPLKALQTWLEMRGKHLPLYPHYSTLIWMERYLALTFEASAKKIHFDLLTNRVTDTLDWLILCYGVWFWRMVGGLATSVVSTRCQ